MFRLERAKLVVMLEVANAVVIAARQRYVVMRVVTVNTNTQTGDVRGTSSIRVVTCAHPSSTSS